MRNNSALTRNGSGVGHSPAQPIDPQMIAYMTRNEADMAFKKRVQTIFEWIEPSDASVRARRRGESAALRRRVWRTEI